MKKILKRLLVVVVVFAVAIGVGLYFLSYDPDKNKEQTAGVPAITDAQGLTYGAVVNENGVTYAVVTDNDQNRFMAEYDGVTVGSTIEQINDNVKAEDLPTNYTGPNVAVSQDTNDYKGNVVTNSAGSTTTPAGTTAAPAQNASTAPAQNATTAVAPSNAPTAPAQSANKTTAPATPGSTASQNTTVAAPSKATTAPAQSANKTTAPATPGAATTQAAPTKAPSQSSANEATRIKKYEQIFRSGTYAMTVEMNDPEYPEPVTMALKNGNIYIETAMSMEEGSEPLRMKMLYIKSEDTMYLILDDLKKYCKLPEDMVADFDMSSMVQDFKINTVGEIKTSTANINGKTLNVESYINESGETVNYYFDGDSIVRLDTIDKNGTTDSVYYSMFTTDVPDSYFAIPDGYGYWNLSWIGALM